MNLWVTKQTVTERALFVYDTYMHSMVIDDNVMTLTAR